MNARYLMLSSTLVLAGIAANGCGENPTAVNDRCMDLPTAPLSARVDIARPSFSNPTNVINPLFPVSSLGRVVLLGNVDGVPLRVETTLMAERRTIDVNGRPVETLVSQYVAWVGRQLHEVAIDWYAQDDAGAVWYFGEDVHNYESGVVVDTDGTWLAGRDGPVAMIMPAAPSVGQAWRPENLCGVVFEEVVAKVTGVTVTGPRGAITGALVTDELHMDGTREDKTFAPGYGEFSSGNASGNLEAVAVAVPTDALPGAIPPELRTLLAGADSVFDAAQARDWTLASALGARLNTAWASFQSGSVPPMLRTQMNTALSLLGSTVAGRNVATSRQAAIDVSLATLDLQLRHRPRTEIDLQLLGVWARQLEVDAAAANQANVLADAASLKWIRDRLATDVRPGAESIDAQLTAIRSAAQSRDFAAAAAGARRLGTLTRGVIE